MRSALSAQRLRAESIGQLEALFELGSLTPPNSGTALVGADSLLFLAPKRPVPSPLALALPLAPPSTSRKPNADDCVGDLVTDLLTLNALGCEISVPLGVCTWETEHLVSVNVALRLSVKADKCETSVNAWLELWLRMWLTSLSRPLCGIQLGVHSPPVVQGVSGAITGGIPAGSMDRRPRDGDLLRPGRATASAAIALQVIRIYPAACKSCPQL